MPAPLYTSDTFCVSVLEQNEDKNISLMLSGLNETLIDTEPTA